MAVVLGSELDRSHYDFEHQVSCVATPEHPSTLKLIAYWRECETRGGMRMGRDVPARPIASLLKDITVSEPVGDWKDARIRLAGFGMAAHFGRDVSGMLMSEVSAPDESQRSMLLAGAKACIAKNRPGTVEQIILDNGRPILRQEMTALPLYAPNGVTRWVLIGTFNF